jgi:peptide/nickel transport system permease protein
MTAYVLRRLIGLAFNLLLISVFLYFMLNFLPGDPTTVILTEQSTAEQRDQFRELHGLNDPLPQQYINWLGGVLTGDLGTSLRTSLPVRDEFFQRLPLTMEIVILSFTFTSIFGVLGGVVAAIRQDSVWDYAFRFTAIFGVSIPSFLILTLLLILPARWWGYAPPFGATEFFDEPIKNLQLMVPPTFLLAISGSAVLMRFTRTAMLDVLRQDYMRTARSKGLTERVVILRHAIRNAMPTVLTFMGLQISTLLGGSVILEAVMALPGLGTWGLAALRAQDYPIFLIFSLYAAAALMVVNLIVDLLYAVIDPRITYS